MAVAHQQKDFSAIRSELEQKLRELTGRASEIDDDLSEAPNPDWDDNAIDSEQDEVLERVGRAAVEEMSEIRQALSRIDAGLYGQCSKCDAPIPTERLEALPFSTRCVKCSQSSCPGPAH